MVPAMRGNVIDALMTVTVLPGARGGRAGGAHVDPQTVRIDWKAIIHHSPATG